MTTLMLCFHMFLVHSHDKYILLFGALASVTLSGQIPDIPSGILKRLKKAKMKYKNITR